MTRRLDLAIIGAGPCGLAAGVAATGAGLDTLLFDRGCVVQSILGYPTYMTFFSTPERLEIGDIPFVVADAKPTRREALTYYRAVAARHALKIRQYETVSEVVPEEGGFRLRTSTLSGETDEVIAAAVVVAIGALARPNTLDVPGEGRANVRYRFREAHPYYDQNVAVIGGGSSAVEAALDLYRAGARVTVIHFEDRFDRGVKPWILPDVVNRIEGGEIQVRWRHRVARVETGAIVIRHEETGVEEEIANDWVFAMTGWRPDHEFLHSLGIRTDPETGVPEFDQETMETNVEGIFLAGVLTAGFDANKVFIENGRHHGEMIVRALLRRGAGATTDASANFASP